MTQLKTRTLGGRSKLREQDIIRKNAMNDAHCDGMNTKMHGR